MCGIFGHITPGRPIDLSACYWVVQALAHRGPDDLGITTGRLNRRTATFHLNPPRELLHQREGDGCDFFLGHRRLSVIDLTPEAFQPMTNEDDTVWVVFNGEIYNHQELRDRLKACGHSFRTDHSDTEVLVHGYEQWGSNLVDELRGMFALAVLDLKTNCLFLARDRFGEKPLYYSSGSSGVMFVSELKALVHLPDLDRTICPVALVDYLHHGLVPAPRSIYRNVRKLRAAEKVTIRLAAAEVARPEIYWSPSYEPVPGKSDSQWFEEFEAELGESIRLRMTSDVPLGQWFRNDLYDDLNDTLLKSDGFVTSLLSRSTIEKLIESHGKGRRDQSRPLWKLYMLEKWNDCHGRRRFADQGVHAPVIRAA